MLEKAVETYLKKEVEKRGGLCWKFESPGNAGVPDRVVMMPRGWIAFVELKAPGEKPRRLQHKRLAQIASLGQRALTASCYEEVDEIMGFYDDYLNWTKLESERYFDDEEDATWGDS